MSTTVKLIYSPDFDEVPKPPSRVRRFTVEQYESMGKTGFLGTNDRVELLEGWIVEKMTQHPPHATALDLAQEALRLLLPKGWRVREQKPILALDSMPEPDIAIVRGTVTRFAKRHPEPSEIAFVIEVADASLDEDRERKGRIYARVRIPVYWIVNLIEVKVEVYSLPKGGKSPRYRQRQDYELEQSIPLLIDERVVGQVPVRDLFPRVPSS